MRIIFASLGAGLFTYASLQLLAKLVMTETFLGLFFQGFIAGSIGLLGYWLLGYLLNMAEMAVFVSAMQKKLFRAVKVAEDTSQEGEGV